MSKALFLTAAASLISAIAFAGPAHAVDFKVEHNFCTKGDCPDGSAPVSTPVTDGAGNFYGTTMTGGSSGVGTVYRMSFDGSKWKYTVIHSFCTGSECAAGGYSPQGGLIIDTAGNLYGMTSDGGNNAGNSGSGVIYELSPNGNKWKFKILYTFCASGTCTDGRDPAYATLAYQGQASGMPYDGVSPLYGTTQWGGMADVGTIFQLTPKGNGWSEKVIYNFCSRANCIDGGAPYAGVTVDGSGNLYGGATLGGLGETEDCCGVLYELKKQGTKWDYVSLHEFCSDVNGVCKDGQLIIAPPTIDGAGNLYGTTTVGGTWDFGTVYKLVPNGEKSKLTTLYNFCKEFSCQSGKNPWAGALVMDAAGTLYGTTLQGAANDSGTVFSLSGVKHDKLTVLTTFKGPNGSVPFAGLVMDSHGALFGAAQAGGRYGAGTFFKVVP